jgi:hypothetical protein
MILDPNQRWLARKPHDVRSVELFKSISNLDFFHGGDYFRWTYGGDGDNGEHLMYLLDMHFEMEDAKLAREHGVLD